MNFYINYSHKIPKIPKSKEILQLSYNEKANLL